MPNIPLTPDAVRAEIEPKPTRNGVTPCCGVQTHYAKRWDRFFCPTCFVWTEPRCNCGPDDDCPFAGDCPPDARGIENGL